ncbi:MAG TPA: tetratricopeptide repeat protein [Terriglobales bacterium]|nr:tetratricopeptide repeat protein [Terriglobales bacterium]
MQYGRWLAPVIPLLLVLTSHAQLHIGGTGNPYTTGSVHIHVLLQNGRNAGPYLEVRLMEGGTANVAGVTYTNDVGEASFSMVPVGSYHVEVSGDGIQTKQSDTFQVDNRKMSQMQWITVERTEDSGPSPVSARSGMVSATDLNVPAKARKELDKANEEMAMHNWKKSLEHLNKAIALAPGWAIAYNNLGVLYAKTNDIPHEEEALKKAVSLDGHFAPALLNYGKLCIRQKEFPQAEALLEKAVTAEPDDAGTLLLLAYSEYMNRHFDAAVASAHQAHALGADHPSFVHYIAARSYQNEGRQQEALAEFETFLKEEPKGPRADHVRGDIARIESAQQQVSAQQPSH